VYYRYGGGEGVILCLYVDDIHIFGTNLNVIKEVKKFLSNIFKMKDLGGADVILNIKLLIEGNGGGYTYAILLCGKRFLSRSGLVTANLLPCVIVLVCY
jgi:hypothetical protein